jgi:parallel beta-helix repeat protein
MLTCARCRQENPDSLRFCTACGHELDQGLAGFLSANGLQSHLEVFRRNDLLEVADLLTLNDADLRELGLPYGDSVRLRAALQSLGSAPSAVADELTTTIANTPAAASDVPPATVAGGSAWIFGSLVAVGLLAALFVFFDQDNKEASADSAASAYAGTGVPAENLIRVPQDHASIASAMAAAHSGSTILVSPGVYEECIELRTGINLRGTDRGSVVLRNRNKSAPVILAVGVSSAVVSDLTVDQQLFQTTDNRFDAVEFRDSSVRMENCRVSCRSSAGLWISGSGNNTVIDCEFEKCGRSGIWALNSTGKSVFQRNVCRDNSHSGILVENSSATVSENTCKGNTWDGISVSGSRGTDVIGNSCSENKAHGIAFVGGSYGRVQGNHCDANAYSGLSFGGSSTRVDVLDNVANNNRQYGISVEATCSPTSFRGNTGSGNGRGQINRQTSAR